MLIRNNHISNPFIIAYTAALIILASLGYFIGDYTVKSQKYRASNDTKHFISDVEYMSLPRMSFTIPAAEGESGRLRMDISLEVERKNFARLQEYQPLITDRIITHLRKMDMNKIRKTTEMTQMRKELLEAINEASYPVPVIDIVFRQMIVM